VPEFQSFKLPAHWRIWVATRHRTPAELLIAIGFDQTLRMIETTTPFEFEFGARQCTALMCLKNTSDEIKAEVWSDVYGEFRKINAGSGGPTYKFMFSPTGPTHSLSSSRL
jgi:hypothetical protein